MLAALIEHHHNSGQKWVDIQPAPSVRVLAVFPEAYLNTPNNIFTFKAVNPGALSCIWSINIDCNMFREIR